MATSELELDRDQQRQSARFQRMGLAARPMPGGRSLLVSLPMSAPPFESVVGPLKIERIVFSTVGPNHIKCLRPRPVFGLPLLDIRRCADARAIEATIRQAWRDRTLELRATGRQLKSLGIDVGAVEGGSVLAFPLAGESPDAQVLMQRLGEAILPSTGPLGGLALPSVEDRVLEVSGHLGSATDLDCRIGTQIQSLQKRAQEAADRTRRSRRATGSGRAPGFMPTGMPQSIAERGHRPRVLLVGPRLIENRALREELARRGFIAATARGETEALARLAAMTPELVLSQYALGRSDGATFIQATRALPGIERIPVVLLDDALHDSRREAARTVGAAGYVIEPVEPDRFVARLQRVVDTPGNRRFTRYPQRLAARVEGFDLDCLATEVGRGGIFIATHDDFETPLDIRCEIALPELGRTLRFAGEVRYRTDSQGTNPTGLGLRFRDLSTEDEVSLIEYLAWLESTRP